MASKFLDANGVLYLWQKIVQRLSGKVDAVTGKGLSTNDLTNELKSSYDAAVVATANIPVVSTDISTDSSSTTKAASPSAVVSYVTNALSGLGGAGLTREIVQALPVSNISDSTIYLVPAATSATGNAYEEYMYINNSWEMIGSTEVDLSDYLTTSDVLALTNAEIDAAISEA